MDGVINVLKPTGMTSHDVVGYIRKNFQIKKVGHTGTLDPNVAGVLPICIGRGTKLSQYIMGKQKTYVGEMVFGVETDTLDSYGKVIESDNNPYIPTRKDLDEKLIEFKGQITQTPPSYSAIKIDGVPLYKKARKGAVIESIPSRQVYIYDFKITHYEYPIMGFEITCSSGTYIRSLVRDFAKELNKMAYMSMLIRTNTGQFNISQGVTLEELKNQGLEAFAVPLSEIDLGFLKVELKPSARTSYLNGSLVSKKGLLQNLNLEENTNVVVYSKDIFLGIGKILIKEEEIYLKSDTLIHITPEEKN